MKLNYQPPTIEVVEVELEDAILENSAVTPFDMNLLEGETVGDF